MLAPELSMRRSYIRCVWLASMQRLSIFVLNVCVLVFFDSTPLQSSSRLTCKIGIWCAIQKLCLGACAVIEVYSREQILAEFCSYEGVFCEDAKWFADMHDELCEFVQIYIHA
jgi:hypothetical protein